MIFRKAELKDSEIIMNFVNDAKNWMKKLRLNQWSDDYPNMKIVEEDIKLGNSYLVEKDGKIVASFAF